MPDVLVIGAGIIGAACARSLAAAGLSVTVRRPRLQLRAAPAPPAKATCSSPTRARAPNWTWPSLRPRAGPRSPPNWPPSSGRPSRRSSTSARAASSSPRPKPGAAALLAFADTQRPAGVDARDARRRRGARRSNPISTRRHRLPCTTRRTPRSSRPSPPRRCSPRPERAARSSGPGVEVIGRVLGADGRITGVRTTQGDLSRATRCWSPPDRGPARSPTGSASSIPVRPRRGMLLVTAPMPHRILHKVYDGDYVGATQSGDADAADLERGRVAPAAGTVLIGSSRAADRLRRPRFASTCSASSRRKALRPVPVPGRRERDAGVRRLPPVHARPPAGHRPRPAADRPLARRRPRGRRHRPGDRRPPTCSRPSCSAHTARPCPLDTAVPTATGRACRRLSSEAA